MSKQLKIAGLISGGGRTLINILDAESKKGISTFNYELKGTGVFVLIGLKTPVPFNFLFGLVADA